MKTNIYSLLLVCAGFVCITSAQAKGGQGIAYYKAGFPQVAKPQLIQEIKEDVASSAEPCFYLGNVYFEENKLDSASLTFSKGLTTDPNNPLNAIGLAMLKIKSNAKEADADIQNALKIKNSSKNVDVLIAVGRAYLVNEKLDEALAYQEKARKIKAKYAPVSVLLGDILVSKKDFGAACSNYEQAILFDNSCKEAYIKYARAYRKVNSALAIEMLGKLKQKEPTFLLADRELADIYYGLNKFDKAAELYENYLKSGNSNVQDLTQYAMTLFLNQNFAKSLEVANIGLQKSSTNAGFNRLAMYNLVALDKTDEALKAADLFFNKSEKPIFTYYDYTYYGQALRKAKQFDAAIAQYQKASTMDSTKVDLYKEISDMYKEKPNDSLAVVFYSKYISKLEQEKISADVLMAFGKLNYSFGGNTAYSMDVRIAAYIQADSAFSKVARLETNYRGNFWRARANSALDPETTKGLAKPFYEKTATLIEQMEDKTNAVRYNSVLLECYKYLGYYYLVAKDNSNSMLYWNKILAIAPTDATALKAIEGISKAMKGKK
jgi:tetratricopeptide (TPR) repeat protein